MLALAEVKEQSVLYKWTLTWSVLYSGVDSFVVSLPKDIAGDVRDYYLSTISNRMNEIMKKLAGWAAIGGINADNARLLLDAGADYLAVISAVFGDADIGAATRALASRFT